jgi:hypothetical protein
LLDKDAQLRRALQVLARQAFDDRLGGLAERSVLLHQNDSEPRRCQTILDLGDQIRGGKEHRIIRCTAIIRSPANFAVGTDQNEAMAITASPHHPVVIRVIGFRDRQIWVQRIVAASIIYRWLNDGTITGEQDSRCALERARVAEEAPKGWR